MCPACGETLVTFALDGIETDHCVACGGTWLDAGELEEIADRSGGLARLKEALKSAGESKHGKRKCVRCGATMTALGLQAIEFDRCPYGHGVWFDKGELVDIVKTTDGAVAGFLKELFKAELKGA